MTAKKLTALPGAPRVLPPPAPDDNAKRALNRYAVARDNFRSMVIGWELAKQGDKQ